MWLTILSDQLLVVGLVGRYPTNYLISREIIPTPIARLFHPRCLEWSLPRITSRFQLLSGMKGQIPHVLLTRSPLGFSPKTSFTRSTCMPNPRRQRSS